MTKMVLSMRTTCIGISTHDMEVKMIHIVIHVQEEQQNPNNYRNLKDQYIKYNYSPHSNLEQVCHLNDK